MATAEEVAPEAVPGLYERAMATAMSLRHALPEELQYPKVAIVCGSGLGGLAESLEAEPRVETPYEKIPNFPRTTDFILTSTQVQGHAGKLVFGVIGQHKLPVVMLVGRAHYYEGHTMEVVTYATRVCKVLGVESMIVTNAAGGLNPEYAVGDIVVLNDHLNLAGLVGIGPLRGPNADDFGTRFPPLSDAYDLDLRRRAHKAWSTLNRGSRGLREGIYCFAGGPTYETRAECRMLRGLGADLVGMSTVPEIVVARHSGVRILAMSLVTNSVVSGPGPRGDDPEIQSMSQTELENYLTRGKANHVEVMEEGKKAAEDMQALVTKILEDLGEP